MTSSLRHYYFDVQNGIRPLRDSIYISLTAAGIGVLAATASFYVIEKFKSAASRPLYFLSILPALIYGTLLIIAIINVYYYHGLGFLIASTSMKQISGIFDEASAALSCTRLQTLVKVTLSDSPPSSSARPCPSSCARW